MSKIVSVIQQKGGVGKTTLTVHLAHELKRMKKKLKVVIADADPQQSSYKWIERGRKNDIDGVGIKAVGRKLVSCDWLVLLSLFAVDLLDISHV